MYSRLYLLISFLNQIHSYLLQSPFICLNLFFIYSYVTLSVSLCECRFMDISFWSLLLHLSLSFVYSPTSVSISCLSTSIYSYLFVYRDWCLPLSTPFSLSQLNPHLSTCNYFYLFSIHHYLFLSLCQSKFTPICFNPVFFISVYSSYIILYLFLSLVYPLLFLYTSLSIQTDAYLFQPHFLYLSLILIYPPATIFISFLSITISFYLLFIQIGIYLFQPPSPNLNQFLVYWPISFSVFLLIQIHSYNFPCFFSLF